MVEWKADDTVAVITMNNGENRFNPEFLSALLDVFDEIEKDESIHAVVITSSDQKNWSQGIDLEWVMETMEGDDRDEMRKFMYTLNDVFKKILLFPAPVIAAIGGHAAAGGAILSCTCDFRFMRSDRGFFFFPEIDINIPFLPGMLAFTERALPPDVYREALLSGKRYTAPELEKHRIIVKACATREDVMTEALAFAKTFQKRRWIFGVMKKRMNKSIIDVLENEDPIYIEPLDMMEKN
jgi:enoyl-CoA hydratase/carnithine racemase